jgi:glycosyltransferase involved in cell wall biosynthesis
MTNNKLKTICSYYHNLYCGGTQRVITVLARIWTDMGYQVIVMTDQPSSSQDYPLSAGVKRLVFPSGSIQTRAQIWEEIITRENIDVVICNDWNSSTYATDLMCIKGTGARFVAILHHCFSGWAYFFQDTRDFENQRTFPFLDALVALSTAQQLWWSCLGASAYYIPNPLTFDSAMTPKANPSVRNIVWIGRTNDSGKRLTDAILVFSKIAEQFPDARLLVIGPLPSKAFRRTLNRLTAHLGLKTKVAFVGLTNDMSENLKNAWVHLSTSIVESFSMVVAEACAYSVPTVMYELPYLAITQTKAGFLAVPQGDIAGLAKALAQVLADRVLRNRLGDEAKTNLAQFDDQVIIQRWRDLFTRLETGQSPVTELNRPCDQVQDFKTIVQEVNRSQNYLFNEQRWKIRFVNYVESFFPTDLYGNRTLKPTLQWIHVILYNRLRGIVNVIRR